MDGSCNDLLCVNTQYIHVCFPYSDEGQVNTDFSMEGGFIKEDLSDADLSFDIPDEHEQIVMGELLSIVVLFSV